MVFVIVIDGIGIRKENTQDNRNAVEKADTPNLDKTLFNSGQIKCHGKFVGLPDKNPGNSEVGHLTMGSGKRVQQPYKKIDRIVKNESMDTIVDKIIDGETDELHFVGLCSNGGVHSDINHLLELIKATSSKGVDSIIHFISDGRDVSRTSSVNYISKIREYDGKISSVAGRHYAMDRDDNTDRTIKTIKTIFGSDDINKGGSARDVIKMSHRKGIFDQYIEPTDIEGKPNIKPDSKVFLFNFRDDRMIQLLRELQENVKETLYTMTKYEEGSSVKHFIDYDIPEETLPEVLQSQKIKQYRVSESEKKPHITWFFDGQKQLSKESTEFRITRSADVDTYDEKPEMRSEWITEQIIDIDHDEEFFCVANFPNPDLVGHTGKFKSTVNAIEAVDNCIGEILESVKSPIILCSDHGNAEEMGSEDEPITSHTSNKVPISVENYDCDVYNGEIRDIAPTVIEILSLNKPKEMSGESLIG